MRRKGRKGKKGRRGNGGTGGKEANGEGKAKLHLFKGPQVPLLPRHFFISHFFG